jgi:hypothetical protein
MRTRRRYSTWFGVPLGVLDASQRDFEEHQGFLRWFEKKVWNIDARFHYQSHVAADSEEQESVNRTLRRN